MNPLSLKYFLAVVEHKSISRAAESLYVSQQNISSHISRLESEYGVVLFDRRPVFRLTYAGEQMVAIAAQILELEKQLQLQLRDIAGNNAGCVTIGVTPTRAASMLSQILPVFHKKYPSVKLRLQVNVSDKLVEQLEKGDIDLFLGFSSQGLGSHIQTVPLELERLCLVVPYHYLEQKYPGSLSAVVNLFRSHIVLSEFADIDFLLPTQGSRVREAADRCIHSQEFTPKILIECPDMPTLIALAKHGMGVAFSFESLAKQLLGKSLDQKDGAFLFPAMANQIEGTVVIGYHKEHYLSYAAQDFIKLTMELYKRPSFELSGFSRSDYQHTQ